MKGKNKNGLKAEQMWKFVDRRYKTLSGLNQSRQTLLTIQRETLSQSIDTFFYFFMLVALSGDPARNSVCTEETKNKIKNGVD